MTDGFADTGSQRSNRSPRTIAVDNLLRKTLRVADPHDPTQIANALLARYPEEAERNRREIAGFGFAGAPTTSAAAIDPGPSGFELESARDDLERDIQTLTTASQLKDIHVEMKGWSRAVRKTAAEGLAAARLALDGNNHDLALSARRTLYQYARLARFVGTLSEGSAVYFRSFARSCDVLAALILVNIGDGLAAGGITRSTMLVRVAASELQARRGAVINALRALTGTLETPLGQTDYPRGIVGYQALIRELELGGQSDLRTLLEESTLASAMDQLVDLTGGASVDSLRELSSTAAILLERFERLILYCASIPVSSNHAPRGSLSGSPESPPLLAFAAAMRLFTDAFTSTGSSRLLRIARPPILAYGLYGISSDIAAQRMIQITIARSTLAEAADCVASCACEPDEIVVTVLLDFILSQIDRAIDLWAVGTNVNGTGDPERRALAGGILAYNAVAALKKGFEGSTPLLPNLSSDIAEPLVDCYSALAKSLSAPSPADGFIVPADLSNRKRTISAVTHELRVAFASEKQTERLVRSLVAGCASRTVFAHRFVDTAQQPISEAFILRFVSASLQQIDANAVIDPGARITLPQTLDASMSMMSSNDHAFFHPGQED